jgi:sec-independent protein translocase protein TatC
MSSVEPWEERGGAAGEEPVDLKAMTFLEHLEELRKRIIITLIALIVAFIACWSFAPAIYDLIQQPIIQLLPEGEKLAYTRVTAPFFLYMKVAFLAAIFLAAPVILLQVWSFISPGLYPRERRYAVPFILFATGFFLLGGWFGYAVVLPLACGFFVEMGRQFQQVITADDYLAFASKLILGMGLVFETPVLILFFSKLGLVTPRFLLKNFKYAVLAIFVVAAIITPPDVVTQAVLAVPIIVLYLFGVAVSWLFAPRAAK